MRVIAGKYKGYKIEEPILTTTRITKERAREGLFSALDRELRDKKVLDLFAGSGSLGFEALSRGASSITLVDQNDLCIKCMMKTQQNLKVSQNEVNIVKGIYPNVIFLLDSPFDIIFLDPPYGKFDFDEMIENLLETKIILNKTTIIVEDIKPFISKRFVFEKTKSYKYGLTNVTVLTNVQE